MKRAWYFPLVLLQGTTIIEYLFEQAGIYQFFPTFAAQQFITI